MQDAIEPDIVEHVMPLALAHAIDHLVQATTAAGMGISVRIDHPAGTRGAGLTTTPATVLIHSHAKGTPKG